MIYRDYRSQKRAQSRFSAVQKLKEQGWRETIEGIWKDPAGPYAFPTKQAIEKMQSRSSLNLWVEHRG